jgi:hypothetical protein
MLQFPVFEMNGMTFAATTVALVLYLVIWGIKRR